MTDTYQELKIRLAAASQPEQTWFGPTLGIHIPDGDPLAAGLRAVARALILATRSLVHGLVPWIVPARNWPASYPGLR